MLTASLAQGSEATDYNVGSVFRTIYESVGIELEGIWAALLSGADADIRQVLFDLLGTPSGDASPASALVQFSVATAPANAISIPQGTIVAVPNSTLQYVTQASGSIPSGQTSSSSIVALCQTVGAVGNVPAGVITQIISPVSLLQANVSVTNPNPVINGANALSDMQRAALAQQELSQLHRGSTDALEAGALNVTVTDSYGNVTEKVTKAQAVPTATPGEADLYLYNGTAYSATPGAGASAALLANATNEINGYIDAQGIVHYGWAVAGQVVNISAVTEVQENVTVAITPAAGLTVAALTSPVQNAITTFFSNLDIGDGLSLSLLVQAVLQTAGVADAAITGPSSSVAGVNGTLLFAGTITVNSQ